MSDIMNLTIVQCGIHPLAIATTYLHRATGIDTLTLDSSKVSDLIVFGN